MTADHAAIRARLDAITPGPWVAEFPEHREDALVYAYDGDQHIADVGGLSTDAEFIAHAPEDMRALLAENEALLAVIDAAPHEDRCLRSNSPCRCWKSRVFLDALHERDRVNREAAWDEGKRDEACYIGRVEDADAAGQGVMIVRNSNPYRAERWDVEDGLRAEERRQERGE